MGEVSQKLLVSRNAEARSARLDEMRAACRKWRADIIAEMASRVGSGNDNDEAMIDLEAEMLHCIQTGITLSFDPESFSIYVPPEKLVKS